ncbi:molybdate transport system substrate-binding protein [Variovorax boronicumulans]|uniref:Molybdate transport system substrate-binding protein n=1 Tax=Variovorax boronicumulans TaxID=436515 RepID=A0AAW8DXB2_9BURK|nr:molybdate ABC transporter substrate-binding protein [Variovorax boronicumulans]MDP9878876.1 molybdate transport system substrate-binding protein [Variovorax boronicumulans]MDP9924160.1 molybdate transport system substrate-binding protein [Variovorax boronicumulans]
MRPLRLLSVVLALALPLAAAAQQITVSAAASLTDAFKEIGPKFEAAKAGSTVRFNFAASGVLLQQIGQGAPVDVFASADQETMNRGNDQKLIDTATRKDFVTNSLVLVEPAQGAVGLNSLQDLSGANVKKIAVGKTATVPVGRYTKQVLDNAKLWTALEPKFVQADSVRQVLDYVSRGEVEAGFVYRTDAAVAGDKVKVAFTPTGHTPVTYPIAVVAESKQKALAGDFIAFLATPAAQEVLTRYGFGKP